MTLPYDPQAYDDPATEVSVALRNGDTGEIEVVVGTVDPVAQTVTFPTSHFSNFQPTSPRPRPLVGGFVDLELTGALQPQLASWVRFSLNAVRGQKGPRSGNAVTRQLNRFEVRVDPDAVRGAVITSSRDQRLQSGTVSAEKTLDLDLGSVVASYQRGRSADVYLRRRVSGDRATVSVLLRRVKGKPTRGALAGNWNAVVIEYSALRGPDGRVVLTSAGQTFRLSVNRDGVATARQASRSVTSVPFVGGAVKTQDDTLRPARGTLVPAGAVARLDMEIGHRTVIDSVDLHAVVRGDALVGVTGDVLGDAGDPTLLVTRLVILSRARKSGTDEDLAGRSRFLGFELGLQSGGASNPVASIALDLLRLDVQHDGEGGLSARGDETSIGRDVAGGPSISQVVRPRFSSSYDVTKSSVYSEGAPFDGGLLLVRRGLYISTVFRDGRLAIGFGLPARPTDD